MYDNLSKPTFIGGKMIPTLVCDLHSWVEDEWGGPICKHAAMLGSQQIVFTRSSTRAHEDDEYGSILVIEKQNEKKMDRRRLFFFSASVVVVDSLMREKFTRMVKILPKKLKNHPR